MVGTDHDVEDDGYASAAPAGRHSALEASDFIRDVVARVAFELATSPEGRAARLSVEVWPGRGVWLRSGEHELCVRIEHGDVRVHGDHAPARPDGAPPSVSHASLGELHRMGEDEVRTLMARWLALRAGG